MFSISDLEDLGMYGVMVTSQRDERVCDSCLGHDGTVYKLDEAKEEEPLPHADCQNSERRCSYVPIPDEDAYIENKRKDPDLSDLRDWFLTSKNETVSVVIGPDLK